MIRRTELVAFWQSSPAPLSPSPSRKVDDRGIALVITLLLLLLMSVLGLAAVLSSSSDLLINGYYSNYRGSFYAADSGLTIERQKMVSYLNGFATSGSTWNSAWTSCSGTQPIASVTAPNNYASSTSLTGSSSNGAAAKSWAESFKITTATFGAPQCQFVGTGTGAPYYVYNIPYTLVSVGSATGSEQATISENGSLIVNIAGTGGSTPTNVSFSAFGAFINNFPACNGPLVYGTVTGPVYAKGNWNFGSGGAYTFTDPVNQTGANFSYWLNNNCTNSSTVPYKSGGTTISPTFESGYHFSETPLTLPQNPYSQLWAVLDGKGCGENNGNVCNASAATNPPVIAPTNAQMNATLTDITKSPYLATGASSGVYLPYNPSTCAGSVCTLNSTGGGIYVEGSGVSSTALTLTAATAGMYTGTTFPTSTQCTSSSCQIITVAQTGSSSTGSPTVSQTGSTSCNTSSQQNWVYQGGRWQQVTTYSTSCTANFQQSTVTTTPTTITTVTTDPTANVTTVQSYVQNGLATTSQTASNSCTVSGQSGCSPSAPGFGACGGSCSTTNSTTNGTPTDLTLAGVPTMSPTLETPATSGCTAAASGTCAETMVYVNDSITISGPSSGAAIQNNAMLTVTANGNIQQTGNLTYATEPVTTSPNQIIAGSNPACCNGDPIDTLIPSVQNMNQVLGLYTATGEFQLNPSSNNGNIETDAAVAMVSSSSTCTPSNNCGIFDTPGNGVGTWTNIGGRAENSINSVNMNASNVYFDRRFTARSNFSPPWFPQTSISLSDITGAQTNQTTITAQRVQWVTSTGGQ